MAGASLVSQACTDNKEAFKRLRDFLCKRNGSYDYSATGIGWTLHDAVYATDQHTVAYNDYFVAYSPGENGDQDLYVKVTLASGYINLHIYLYWNAATQTGVTAASTANNWTHTNATACTLWVFGNLDHFWGVAKYGSTYYLSGAGHCPDSRWATAVATSSGSITAGSSVAVTVDAVPAEWSVGRKLHLRDNANCEQVTISAIEGSVVTLATVAASYASGAKLLGEFSAWNIGFTSGVGGGAGFVLSHTGAKSAAHSRDSITGTPGAYNDTFAGGSYPMAEIFCSATNSFIGPLPGVWLVHSSGLTNEGTLSDGVANYRYFQTNGSHQTLLREY